MVQVWEDLLFAHWALDPAVLRPLVPAGLTLDLYEGRAWLSVVPFRMDGVRLRGTPSLPRLSRFLEINVRTYVTVEERPGVFFFSLDAASHPAVRFGRRWLCLPYVLATMAATVAGDGWIDYRSLRSDRAATGRAEFTARYRPSGPALPAAAGTLERWLTARYCFYSVDRHGGLHRGEIDHRPWPLQTAEAEIQVNTLLAPLGIGLPNRPTLVQFARRLPITAWPLQRVSSPAPDPQ